MTDAKGRIVNFKNTIIILTSNIGSEYIDKMEKIGFTTGEEEKKQYEGTKVKVLSSLKDYFRPEFLNRLDEIIIYNILTPAAIKKIVVMQMSLIEERLRSKDIELKVSAEVLDYLGKQGYDPQYGARPLGRLIQNKILTPVASLMISNGVMEGGSIRVDLKNNEFTFDVKKRKSVTLGKRKVRTSTKKEKVLT